MNVELVVEGRRFPAVPAKFALAFAQHMADDTQRPVQVFERAPGAAKAQRDVVYPNHTYGAKP